MIANTINMSNEQLSRASINSLLETLQYSLKKDKSLANDLVNLLKEHNISISNDLNKLIPVSFTKKTSTEQINKLKVSFDNDDIAEYLL